MLSPAQHPVPAGYQNSTVNRFCSNPLTGASNGYRHLLRPRRRPFTALSHARIVEDVP